MTRAKSKSAKTKKDAAKKCPTCNEPMKNEGTHFKQATSGPIAGWDITTFRCGKGHVEEDSRTVD